MSVIDTLAATVAEANTVMASAMSLLKGLHDRLVAAIAAGDMAQVQALADDLHAHTDALAAAVAANTVAEPAVAPAEPAPAPVDVPPADTSGVV